MIIEDKFTIAAPGRQVWDLLLDIPEVSGCMPGVENIEQLDDQNFKGNLVVKVGPIKANFGMTVGLVAVEAPYRLTAEAKGKDKNTGSMVSATFAASLDEVEPGVTEVSHEMDVTIRGRLGQFGQGVIRETAKQMTALFVECLTAKVAAADAATAGAPAGEAGAATAVPPPTPTASAQPSLLTIVLRAIWAALRNLLRGKSGQTAD